MLVMVGGLNPLAVPLVVLFPLCGLVFVAAGVPHSAASPAGRGVVFAQRARGFATQPLVNALDVVAMKAR